MTFLPVSTSRLLQAIALLFGTTYFGLAAAFDYSEHYSITYESLRTACSQVEGEISGKAVNLCSSEEAISCVAHMAAVAGDYASAPTEFEEAKEKKILRRNEQDCQDIAAVLEQSKQVAGKTAEAVDVREAYVPQKLTCVREHGAYLQTSIPQRFESRVLVANPLRRGWRWFTLATNNSLHFQPQAPIEFERHRVKATWKLDEKDRASSIRSVFAEHAFSLHFLEDSFASGHIGLERSSTEFGAWGSRQDYAHAYHDDLNWGGQFLRNSVGHEWYSYGDKNLCTPTFYVLAAQWPASLSIESRREAVKSIAAAAFRFSADEPGAARTAREESKFVDLLVEEIDALAKSSSASGSVASMPIKRPMWAICGLFVFCNKLELVMISANQRGWAERNFDDCETVTGAKSLVMLVACFDTFENVFEAATRAQVTFLRALSDQAGAPPDHSDISNAADSVSELIPSEFAFIDFAESTRSLNFEPLLLRHRKFEPVESFQLLKNSAWGLGLSRQSSRTPGIEDQALDLMLQARLDSVPVSVRWSLLASHGDHVSAFDKLEASFDFARVSDPWKRLVSIAPSIHAGIDSVFRGGNFRNVYAGLDLGLELDVGRYVLYAKLGRDVHWNSDFGRVWSTTLACGLKIPSIDLAP